jgi:hypothetical protein
MKKLLSALMVLLFAVSTVNAQNNKPEFNFTFQNLAQLQNLPKQTRDSLVRQFKKANISMDTATVAKGKSKDVSRKLVSASIKYYKTLTGLMIQVLENPSPELVAKNQAKFDKIQAGFEFDMNVMAEKMGYEEKKKSIISHYKEGTYDDADDRREAKKEMQDELKELKNDYNEKLKEAREERDERFAELAEDKRDA